MVDRVEAVIHETASRPTALEEKENHALGMLCYKLGTYYLHILRNPEIAIEKLRKAEMILRGKKAPSKDFFVSELTLQMLRPLVSEITSNLGIKQALEDPEVLALVAKKLRINDWVIC